MTYQMLAGLVVAVHLGYLAFVGIGAVLALRWRRLLWPHLACMAVAFASVAVGFNCPLTHLEKSLRRLAGERPDAGGFVDHYIVGTLFPPGQDRLAQGVVAVVVVVAYGSVVLRRSRARSNVSQGI